MTAADLRELAEEFGEVADTHLLTDHATNQSRGMGFVGCVTPDDARAVIAGIEGREHQGRRLRAEAARPRGY